VGGSLGGLPVVAGPILFILSLEQGQFFASQAAASTLAAVFSLVSFSLVYSLTAQRFSWVVSSIFSLLAWVLTAWLISIFPVSIWYSLALALLSLVITYQLFPRSTVEHQQRIVNKMEYAYRMLVGSLLTVTVSSVALTFGEVWTGLFSAFPVITCVMAVFSHKTQ
jgi:hypothetical protein